MLASFLSKRSVVRGCVVSHQGDFPPLGRRGSSKISLASPASPGRSGFCPPLPRPSFFFSSSNYLRRLVSRSLAPAFFCCRIAVRVARVASPTRDSCTRAASAELADVGATCDGPARGGVVPRRLGLLPFPPPLLHLPLSLSVSWPTEVPTRVSSVAGRSRVSVCGSCLLSTA